MKSYPITFDLYRKLVKEESLNERVTILLKNEFYTLRQSLPKLTNVDTLCKLANGISYLIFDIDNTPIPVSLFKFTKDTRGWAVPIPPIDLIAGIYLEKRFQDYEDKIKSQIADGLQNNYSAGDWVIRKSNTKTEYIHNVYHKARLYLGEKLKRNNNLVRITTALSNQLTDGDYIITNSNYPDQLVSFSVVGPGKLLIPEFCEIPADMNKIVNKLIFISNLTQLNPTIIN